MSFPVENIRAACEKNGTTLAQLERDLGIGNGVIARWAKAKGSPPYERLLAIADRLGVSVHYLRTGETGTKKSLSPEAEGICAAKREVIDWVLANSDESAEFLLEMIKRMK